MTTFYLTPKYREFANDCEFAYLFDGTEEEAELLAQEYDCRWTADPDFIERLQKRMHRQECTELRCALDVDEDEDDDGFDCGFVVESADDWCDGLPSDWKNFLEEKRGEL